MSGYWRDAIEAGHKTGPYRTSIKAVQQYEDAFNEPFARNSYKSAGFKKDVGRVSATPTMISPKNIVGLVPGDLPDTAEEPAVDPNTYRIYSDENVVRSIFAILGYRFVEADTNSDGFKETSLRTEKRVVSLADAVAYVPNSRGASGGGTQSRRYYPCYTDVSNNTTLRYVVIIEDGKQDKLPEIDAKFPSIAY
jgi:hypothetical protein